MFDARLIRNQFPILNTQDRKGQPLVYLDNAATTQKPWQVMEALADFYEHHNANIHRGIYQLADDATQAYESVRAQVAQFINATPEEVIFCGGTTEAINMVAHGWGYDTLSPGDEVLVTAMEHHANFVPWQVICDRTGATFKVLPLEPDGSLSLTSLEQALTKKTKLLAITQISNTTGIINPLAEITKMAHQNDTLVLVDAAQSIANDQIDVQSMNCDFLAFSGHKLYGPMGVGVLYGKSTHLEKMSPFQQGGSMIYQVSNNKTTFKKAPHKFEAGTPPVAAALGLGAAIRFINTLGMANIKAHAQELRTHAWGKLSDMNDVALYGVALESGAIISLNIKDIHPHDVATVLGEAGLAVRAGHHCTQPLMQHYGIVGTVRISFSVYNTLSEIDHFISALSKVKSLLS